MPVVVIPGAMVPTPRCHCCYFRQVSPGATGWKDGGGELVPEHVGEQLLLVVVGQDVDVGADEADHHHRLQRDEAPQVIHLRQAGQSIGRSVGPLVGWSVGLYD